MLFTFGITLHVIYVWHYLACYLRLALPCMLFTFGIALHVIYVWYWLACNLRLVLPCMLFTFGIALLCVYIKIHIQNHSIIRPLFYKDQGFVPNHFFFYRN